MGFQLGFPALRNLPPAYDPDVQTWINGRATAGDPVPTAYANAVNQYVLDLKAISGHWDAIIQLVVMAGATTINGACVAIKGNNLTPISMVNGDVGIKTGIKGNFASSKYLETGYSGSPSGTGQNNFHMYARLTEQDTVTPAQARTIYGNGGTAASRRLMVHDSFNSNSPFRMNGGATFNGASPGTGNHGISRGSSTSFNSLIAGTSTTHTDTSVAASSGPYYLLARGPDTGSTPIAGSYSNARILVWALGSNVTLSNYTTPTDNLITALNAI